MRVPNSNLPPPPSIGWGGKGASFCVDSLLLLVCDVASSSSSSSSSSSFSPPREWMGQRKWLLILFLLLSFRMREGGREGGGDEEEGGAAMVAPRPASSLLSGDKSVLRGHKSKRREMLYCFHLLLPHSHTRMLGKKN